MYLLAKLMVAMMKIKRVAIVGGGTAGWLAANHLAVELKAEPNIEITVIESPEIGIIGVGEGTVPHIRKSLQKFGISEAELLASCDCTFKCGIKFVDWLCAEKNGKGNFFYHPFSSPYPGGYDVTPYYLQNNKTINFSAVTEVTAIAEAMKSPKRMDSLAYEGVTNYAYHFNAVKFGQLLARNATQRFGVKRKSATIVEALLNEQGDVDVLITSAGEKLEYDFYVDCSGFHSLLLGNLLQIKFVDKSAQILSDTAIAVQIPIPETSEVAPYTLATAHGAGWVWDIPLINRRGVGFVYSSQYMNDERALTGLANYLNVEADSLSPRKIQMQIGYREKFWHKNVVALGLAQGFVEPLEATSILVTDFCAELFARNFSVERSTMSVAANYCNKVVAYTWERVMDFVQMHYCISNRTDSEFWRANTIKADISDVLAERLEMWEVNSPKKSDFFSRFDLFDVDNYLYVLYGMKYKTNPKAMTQREEKIFAAELEKIMHQGKQLEQGLLGHREWLTRFNNAYQSSITKS
ncbi:tryptophan halogenase family protein [Cellvibrio sp. NN19]|uniref:tryptophan halogenase family protein n=1 Tax=Cellvibrio chitinivorans TaxID=3102792 RepID=UPI002B409101|nr:tryptophan halogenase family protein [Cellvibrio sp. NN19]